MSQISVGKIASLSTAYPAIKSSATSWKEIDKNHRTWILLAALYYDSPVKLQRINQEAVAAEAEADVERAADDRDDGGTSSTIADASALMNVAQHYFLDNEETLRSISDCLKGGGHHHGSLPRHE